MAVPTPTSEYLDITIPPFSESGSPTKANGPLGNVDVTYDFDGVNDYLTSSVEPISTGNKHSVRFWVYMEAGGTLADVVMAQYASNSSATLRIFMDASNDLVVAGWFSGTNANFVQANSVASTFTKSAWYHVVCTVDGSTGLAEDNKIYISGQETTYGSRVKIGTGFVNGVVSHPNLQIASQNTTPANFLKGRVARIAFWEGTELTASEVAEDFQDETTVMTGSPLMPPAIPRAIPSVFSRDLYTI